MGWSIGFDTRWKRDIGYGVPAHCDQPGCNEKIDRGLAYVCGGEPYGGDRGCGLYFCAAHMRLHAKLPQLCSRCSRRVPTPYPARQDHHEWLMHKLGDKSWAAWRKKNKKEVVEMQEQLERGQHRFIADNHGGDCGVCGEGPNDKRHDGDRTP